MYDGNQWHSQNYLYTALYMHKYNTLIGVQVRSLVAYVQYIQCSTLLAELGSVSREYSRARVTSSCC